MIGRTACSSDWLNLQLCSQSQPQYFHERRIKTRCHWLPNRLDCIPWISRLETKFADSLRRRPLAQVLTCWSFQAPSKPNYPRLSRCMEVAILTTGACEPCEAPFTARVPRLDLLIARYCVLPLHLEREVRPKREFLCTTARQLRLLICNRTSEKRAHRDHPRSAFISSPPTECSYPPSERKDLSVCPV